MTKVDKIIEEARQLPRADRTRLLEAVEGSLARSEADESEHGECGPLLALAGTVESDFADLAGDKYPHIADAASQASDG